MNTLLTINNLTVHYQNGVKALDDISFDVNEGEVFGVVGESGSGKSTLGFSILNLLPSDSKKTGSIIFQGRDILSLNQKDLNNLRGNEIGFIMQEPAASFNPVLTIGYQFRELLSEKLKIKDRFKQNGMMLDSFAKVSLPDSERILKSYPHQLSGGQLQRIAIAIVMNLNPKIIIADEPTSSLDVTVESQIINLFGRLQKELKFTFIFITHNLGIAKHLCNRIAVLYRGRLREINNAENLFNNPQDEYSKKLLFALRELE